MNIKSTINNHAIVGGLISLIWMAPIYAMNDELALAQPLTLLAIQNDMARYLNPQESQEENSEPPSKRRKKEIAEAAIMADNSVATVFSTPEGPRRMLKFDPDCRFESDLFDPTVMLNAPVPFGESEAKEWPSASLELDDAGVREGELTADDERALCVFADFPLYEMLILARDKETRAHIQRTKRPEEKEEYGSFELHNKKSFLKAVTSARSCVVKKYADYHKAQGTLNDIYNQAGATPLIMAIGARRMATIVTLLECGADPNAPREYDRRLTPLKVALQESDPTFKALVILHLLDHGAHPDPNDDTLIPSLIYSVRIRIVHKFEERLNVALAEERELAQCTEVAQILTPPQNTHLGKHFHMSQGEGGELFHALIHEKKAIMKKIAREWQRKGWINSKYSKKGLTPLHLAITSYSLDKVKIILRMGGDMNRPNLNGVSPLQYALDLGNRPKIVAWLQAQGALAFVNNPS